MVENLRTQTSQEKNTTKRQKIARRGKSLVAKSRGEKSRGQFHTSCVLRCADISIPESDLSVYNFA